MSGGRDIRHQNAATILERTGDLVEAGQGYNSIADAPDAKYNNGVQVSSTGSLRISSVPTATSIKLARAAAVD